MFVVGLTGGIGSGKSTVAALFRAKGVPIIDADEIARKVTESGTPVLKSIVEIFGPEVLLPDQKLNRAKLKNLIFANESLRKKLEQLLHPLIRAEMKSYIETLKAPYCIAMIPLLLETTPNPLINRILIIDTTEESQITRTITRDNMRREEVETILRSQINRAKRLKLADDIITNTGIFEDLIPQVDQLNELYLSLSQARLSAK